MVLHTRAATPYHYTSMKYIAIPCVNSQPLYRTLFRITFQLNCRLRNGSCPNHRLRKRSSQPTKFYSYPIAGDTTTGWTCAKQFLDMLICSHLLFFWCNRPRLHLLSWYTKVLDLVAHRYAFRTASTFVPKGSFYSLVLLICDTIQRMQI